MFLNKYLALIINHWIQYKGIRKGLFHDISGDDQTELWLVRDQDNRMQFALKKEEMHSREMFECKEEKFSWKWKLGAWS